MHGAEILRLIGHLDDEVDNIVPVLVDIPNIDCDRLSSITQEVIAVTI